MADLLIGAAEWVKSQFSWKEVDSSNTVFKLFAKASVGLCLLASILVASAEYLGKPITCEHGTGKLLDTPTGIYTAYCWIHGGKKLTDPRKGYGISEKQAEQFDCKVNYNTVSSKNTWWDFDMLTSICFAPGLEVAILCHVQDLLTFRRLPGTLIWLYGHTSWICLTS